MRYVLCGFYAIVPMHFLHSLGHFLDQDTFWIHKETFLIYQGAFWIHQGTFLIHYASLSLSICEGTFSIDWDTLPGRLAVSPGVSPA